MLDELGNDKFKGNDKFSSTQILPRKGKAGKPFQLIIRGQHNVENQKLTKIRCNKKR